MNILIATPKLRTIGRVAISHWAARKEWGKPHTTIEVQGQEGEEGNKQVLAKYEQIRNAFLRGPWDALLTLEDDILIPTHTIDSLASCLTELEADIAYGLYVWRRSSHPWNAYTRLEGEEGESISTSEPDRARMLARSAGVAQVAGLGNGCTLIKREVLQTISFRSSGRFAQDWALGLDAQAMGYRQVCHFGVVCGHIDMRGAYRIYWPDAEAPQLWREEIADV